jgi:hypothetical protein
VRLSLTNRRNLRDFIAKGKYHDLTDCDDAGHQITRRRLPRQPTAIHRPLDCPEAGEKLPCAGVRINPTQIGSAKPNEIDALLTAAKPYEIKAVCSHGNATVALNREKAMKRAAIYLRVSTVDQHTSNQEHELRQAAERAGWEVVKVYRDHGISGAKGRDQRPAFDALCRDANRRQLDVVMA